MISYYSSPSSCVSCITYRSAFLRVKYSYRRQRCRLMCPHTIPNSKTNTEKVIIAWWILRIAIEKPSRMRCFSSRGHHCQCWLKGITRKGRHGGGRCRSWELRWTKGWIWHWHVCGFESISFVVIELLLRGVMWCGMNAKANLVLHANSNFVSRAGWI